MRKREELDYLQEPDIFHEVYGHCPLLTDRPTTPTPSSSFGLAAKKLGPDYFTACTACSGSRWSSAW